ncbi:YvrJ family protein [Salibacterium salarium]|uniref:YvrJ family protein n=1 Tax=Salibacterium salarium TaxID=284579 RepID=A0A3R9PZY4_9BACI|nr:YvrJ family protein [Salibacterium salarium]RSL30604.1 YvrJ family protein [Salibacterium salarium]
MNVLNAAGFVQMLANFGFPIVITFYLLFRFEKRIERIEHLLQESKECPGSTPTKEGKDE